MASESVSERFTAGSPRRNSASKIGCLVHGKGQVRRYGIRIRLCSSPAGFDPDHGDWAYAIHWAAPPARWAAKLGGPIYWRSPSHKVGYCVECHDNYDRNLGDVPGDQKIKALP